MESEVQWFSNANFGSFEKLLLRIFLLSRVCIPNTRPPGQELKAGVFLVLGLSFVNFIPAVLLIVLNTLIVARLFVMARPGENNLSKDIKTIKHRDSKTKVSIA